jgi:mono/diheme cytochrome c family protein
MRREAHSRRLAASAVVLAIAAGVVLAGCDLIPRRSPSARLWRQRCAQCHGITGDGNTPQYMGNAKADLLDDQWQHGGEPGSWAVVIREGVFGSMPANPDLSREQVDALVQYMRELRGEAAPRAAGR